MAQSFFICDTSLPQTFQLSYSFVLWLMAASLASDAASSTRGLTVAQIMGAWTGKSEPLKVFFLMRLVSLPHPTAHPTVAMQSVVFCVLGPVSLVSEERIGAMAFPTRSTRFWLRTTWSPRPIMTGCLWLRRVNSVWRSCCVGCINSMFIRSTGRTLLVARNSCMLYLVATCRCPHGRLPCQFLAFGSRMFAQSNSNCCIPSSEAKQDEQ